MGVHRAEVKRERLTQGVRRQAKRPENMSFKNPNFLLLRISQRIKINWNENIQPMIRNMHWKWSGSIILGVLSKSTPASPFAHKSSIWSSWFHSKFSQSVSKDLTVKPDWKINKDRLDIVLWFCGVLYDLFIVKHVHSQLLIEGKLLYTLPATEGILTTNIN